MIWEVDQGFFSLKYRHLVVVRRRQMAPHSSPLAWEIPWTEEPGRLQFMGSPRVGHDWATSLSLFTFMRWRRQWQPTPVFLPGESQGREPGGLLSMGSHGVGHDWRDLAAAAMVVTLLLNRFFFLHWITFVPLWKLSGLCIYMYIYESTYGLYF